MTKSVATLCESMPADWQRVLGSEMLQAYFRTLAGFVARERRSHQVFPAARDVFAALGLTPFDAVKVLFLGQDPYHGDGQAHGLCFSVAPDVALPPSLRNIFRELVSDTGCAMPGHGCLSAWAAQGCLLLNTVLTVRAHQAHSHRGRGWETFTDAIIRQVNGRSTPVVFVLWGKPAQKKACLIDQERHTVLTAPHPSPLSAHRGFFGSRPFTRINDALVATGQEPIEWGRGPNALPTSPHASPP